MEQTYEPTNRNWIGRRQGRTSQRLMTKSLSIKVRKRKSSGGVRKASALTPGSLGRCPSKDRWNCKVRSRGSGVRRGHSSWGNPLKARTVGERSVGVES